MKKTPAQLDSDRRGLFEAAFEFGAAYKDLCDFAVRKAKVPRTGARGGPLLG